MPVVTGQHIVVIAHALWLRDPISDKIKNQRLRGPPIRTEQFHLSPPNTVSTIHVLFHGVFLATTTQINTHAHGDRTACIQRHVYPVLTALLASWLTVLILHIFI
ncbi:hypothetical protein M422DRAFT_264910 [Sphaerobolus stellatus SS14]|uniref:Uncharacterized protein n=1 Tax=Sphaerobolus stellatus (strain SS14) TaxID=990650 RepID=A0A0C9TSD4_SPHS4|nr:hypothetical protein M422DRAFT_264910 [Sphaerobolus stellatus SS14]